MNKKTNEKDSTNKQIKPPIKHTRIFGRYIESEEIDNNKSDIEENENEKSLFKRVLIMVAFSMRNAADKLIAYAQKK